MSKSMTMTELGNLIKYIHKNNCPFGAARMVPIVKYIDPHIDNRSGECFSITFRGFCTDTNFSVTNEHISNPIDLYDRCMTYVNTGKIT